MSFDGIPFSIDKVNVLDCRYGIECITGRNKREKENDKKKHLKLQWGTRKIGVHANIQIHTYTIFSEFYLTSKDTKGFLCIDYTRKTKRKNLSS